MPLGNCLLGQYPGYAGPGAGMGMGPGVYNGAAVKPLAGAAKGLYPGACKFVGYSAFAGKGACLGLGMGLGVLGPLLLIGAGVAAGYLIFQDRREIQREEKE